MKLRANLVLSKNFLSQMKIRPVFFILPIVLTFCAAVFDGLSIGLLVPLVKGSIAMNFDFVRTLPVFRIVTSVFPNIFSNTNNPNSSIFVLLLAIIVSAAVMKNISSYLSTVLTEHQTQQLSRNMRNTIFTRYLKFGKLFFDRTNIGHLNIILVSFTQQIAEILTKVRGLINSVFTLSVYFVIMCVISWRLTILTILFLPIFYYSINWLIKKIENTSKAYAQSRIDQSWRIFDILSCISLVKSYAKEEDEKKRFSELSNSVARLEFSTNKKMLFINPIQELVVIGVLLFIISAAAFMVSKNHAESLSSFVIFFYITRKSAPLFNSINIFKADIAKSRGALNNVMQILNDKDKFFIKEGTLEFRGLQTEIEFKNLNFNYVKNIHILKNISIVIKKNKVTAIVGPSGSGKTTIINLIFRFYECPPGSIFVDGIDIRDFTLKSLKANMVLISQETLLFNDTIRYNLSYGLSEHIPEAKLIEVTKKARLYDFIMSLPDKFNTFIGDRGVRLSGGEKQRMSIARGILKGAEILILDEATSSLDSRTERLIKEAMDELMKEKTAIVIAHRLSTIRHADKIIVIDNGKVAEVGVLKELLDKKGKFYEYWQEQKFY